MRRRRRTLDLCERVDQLRDGFAHRISRTPRAVLGSGEPIRVVHQYTRLGTAIEMFRPSENSFTCEVWATSLHYMNDTEEFEHARNNFIDMAASLSVETDSTGRRWAYEAVRRWAAGVDGRSVFCACYSAKGDDLNQWRGYADAGRGVCLSFDLKPMQEAFPQYSGWVVYKQEEKRELLCTLVEDLVLALHETNDGKRYDGDEYNPLRELLPLVFSFIKHPKFEEEAEFRIAYLRNRDVGPIESHFRVSGTRIQPYVKLKVLKNGQPTPLPLRQIMLSPGACGDHNLEAVKEILLQYGMADVRSAKSEVPFLPNP